MTQFKYATKKIQENMTRARLVDSPISSKASIEIANYLRGKSAKRAKQILQDAITLEKPIPYKRFTNGPGHKPGQIASGRFPVKACTHFMNLINAAESNAREQGLNANDMVIYRLIVQKASRPYHYGRKSRRKMKRSHVELILQEKSKEQKEDKRTKITSKETPKPDARNATPESKPVKPKEAEKPAERVKPNDIKPITKTQTPKEPKVTEKMLKG